MQHATPRWTGSVRLSWAYSMEAAVCLQRLVSWDGCWKRGLIVVFLLHPVKNSYIKSIQAYPVVPVPLVTPTDAASSSLFCTGGALLVCMCPMVSLWDSSENMLSHVTGTCCVMFENNVVKTTRTEVRQKCWVHVDCAPCCFYRPCLSFYRPLVKYQIINKPSFCGCWLFFKKQN